MIPESLRLARFRFDLEAIDPISLPVHQSSTFRGGFGHAFKRMVCFQRDWRACTPCAMQNACPYGYIFETSAPKGVEALRNMEEAPPPFVIDAPIGQWRVYQPGERFGFELLLVGRASAYLPYFLLAFQELGRLGLGKPAGRYALQRVSAVHPWQATRALVYDGVEVLAGTDLSVGAAEISAWAADLPTDQVTLRFLTPTRIKYQASYVMTPEFPALIGALVRRVWALSYFHCGTEWQVNGRELVASAEQVRLMHHALHWDDWQRRSGRQGRNVPMGGFVGEATYAGDLAPFRELLALGTLVHVGKATVFGHGHYEVSR